MLAIAVAFLARGGSQALLVVLAAAATWIAVPFAARLARRWGAVATPGGRSVHSEATPLLGGLAVALPLLAGMVALGGSRLLSLAAASGLMLATGVIDDLGDLKASAKLLLQLLAVLLLFWGGYRIPWILFSPLSVPLAGLLGLAVLAAWVVLVTNAMNLADGLDGLAAGFGLVAALSCIVVGFGDPLAAILAGALVGFFRYNLPRARIFLGDAGSLMLGLVVAVLLLGDGRGLDLPLVLAVLALPLGDVAVSIARRALRGKPIFASDRGHVHHLLLSAWHSPGWVLAGLLGLASLQAAAGILWPDLAGVAVVACLWAGLLGYLVAVHRVRWQKILSRRRPFQRIHLLARYAVGSLRLAESRARVETLLTRVVEDLGVVDVRPGKVVAPCGGTGCGAAPESPTAGCYRAIRAGAPEESDATEDPADDPVYEEERQTVLKAIFDTADAVFDRLGEERPHGSDGRAGVHLLVGAESDGALAYALAARRSSIQQAQLGAERPTHPRLVNRLGAGSTADLDVVNGVLPARNPDRTVEPMSQREQPPELELSR